MGKPGFLSVDPQFATTKDRYGYTAGNPIARVDPSGLDYGGLCTSQSLTVIVVQFSHETCGITDLDEGPDPVIVTDSWGAGVDAVGLGITISGGGFYSSADSESALEGIDMCASVAVGAGGAYYAEVCVGEGWNYSISWGAGYSIGFSFSVTGGAVFGFDFSDVKARLRCERAERERRKQVASRPYVDVATPQDGQSAGTPGGASPGRPDILGPKS